MGRIGADQPRLPGRWLRQQIATDVTRGQSPGTHTRQHQVRKVLAHPPPPLQHLHQRSCDLRGLGVEGELAEDLLHQRLYPQHQRPPRRKTAFGEFDEGALQVHIRRLEAITTRLQHLVGD
ncbi:hypothetical protein D3C81_1396430 [compost metagenome]